MTKRFILLLALAAIFILMGCKMAPIVGSPADAARLHDGEYQGFYEFGPNKATVKVTIRDQRIAKVEILEHDAWKGKKAEPVIPQRIIEAQSTRVDVVSGATNSSNVIMNAVQNAVEKALSTE